MSVPGAGGVIFYPADPDAVAASPMMRRKTMCDGQATGNECKFYWFEEIAVDTAMPELLKIGDRSRRCMLVTPSQNMDMIDMSVRCNQYVSSGRPFDPATREYEPLTKAEVAANKALIAEARAQTAKDVPLDEHGQPVVETHTED